MVVDDFPKKGDNKQFSEKIGSPKSIGSNSVFLNMYFDDVNTIYKKAIDECASEVMSLSDVFREIYTVK